MPTLFDPLQLGDLSLPNRIIMAPLTRCRAEPGRVPGDLMVEYYRQRAGAGLIFSEATAVSPMGVGYPDTPGIWSGEQVEGWKKVTAAVHEAGGRIILQLWHVGRISDPLYLDGAAPVAPSAIQPAGTVSLVRPKKAYVTPRALATDEIPDIVEAYRRGAENALAAGFDGVEIHAANGYLIDQFLQSRTNRRTDAYGGPVENRARLLLEITDAVLQVWAPGRVGVHLSPRGDSHDMGDDHPGETFGYVAEALGRRGIAFLCLREYEGPDSLAPMMREKFPGSFIANEAFDKDKASSWLAQGRADAVAFGKLFIANPDLPARFALDAPLNALRPELFYAAGAEGYTDYPALERCGADA
ncbi:alkene reductase [Castellaniella daejeonensis]|jgi:2,4-dienoyl-CoA reductase-like NADH-dependent reductase (Old Yellow Enzyme family)|uniref:Alkene reductase n=1 Tax=Castellaniella daejeonensis TaxID=659013 RepID=A0ABP3D1Y6_9BURK|nr:alkene reductase [Castellaniella sp.]HET8703615.1 alkene reductase [Castellaniella sp.]